jgi:hypothetical protein
MDRLCIVNILIHEVLLFLTPKGNSMDENDLVYRLRKRAEIRRQIPDRKSVQENKPDRIADLLEEAANEIVRLRETEWMYEELTK